VHERQLSPSGERLLDVAAEVFYAEGIRATGVDTLVERARVSKPTLYAQFGSKEQLIAAVLERRSRDRRASLAKFLAGHEGPPKERLLAVFDWLAQGHQRAGFRGCPFTNAAVELPDPDHPARLVIAAYKLALRDVLREVAAEAGLPDPARIASELSLLIDGANARVVVFGDREAIRHAKRAAVSVVGGSPASDVEGAPNVTELLRPGLAATMDYRVPNTRTVPHLLPEAPEFTRMPQVLATGYLIGLVEQTCMKAVQDCLDESERTVGVHVDLSHEAPSPPGALIRFDAELVTVHGRELTFSIRAAEYDGTTVCRGTHKRAVIDLARFESKARARRSAPE